MIWVIAPPRIRYARLSPTWAMVMRSSRTTAAVRVVPMPCRSGIMRAVSKISALASSMAWRSPASMSAEGLR